MPMLSPVRCDSGGNLYLRLEPGALPDMPFSKPITKFSSEGEKKAVYSLENAAGWTPGDIDDFVVAQDGTVYFLADHLTRDKKLVYGILSFDGDGNFLSAVRLHLPIQNFERLAVFSTGQFLVTGTDKVKPAPPQIPGKKVTEKQLEGRDDEEPPLEPIAFVVDRRGEVVKKVNLPEDPLSVKNGKAYGSPLQFGGSREGYEWIVAGNQGNVYAMFPTSEPIVYVISPAGDIVRSFFVRLPQHYTPFVMKWAWGFDGLLLESGEIVKQGITAQHMLFSVIDPSTGQVVGNYRVTAKLGVTPACFTQQNIFFLGSDKGKLVMREAEIQ